MAVLAIDKSEVDVVHHFLDEKPHIHFVYPLIESAIVHIKHITLLELEIVVDGITIPATYVTLKKVAHAGFFRLVHLLIRVAQPRYGCTDHFSQVIYDGRIIHKLLAVFTPPEKRGDCKGKIKICSLQKLFETCLASFSAETSAGMGRSVSYSSGSNLKYSSAITLYFPSCIA